MFEIVLAPGDKALSVVLTLDLSGYCIACKDLYEAETKKLADTSKYEETFKTAYNELLKSFHMLKAGFYWPNICKLLAGQCDTRTPLGKELAEMLADPYSAPLAIVSLNNSFSELLKNSVDAFLSQYLSGASTTLVLQMDIQLMVTLPTISVCITDNAGGFCSEFIDLFMGGISRGDYNGISLIGRKKSTSSLGGKGIALWQLCDLLLKGETSHGFLAKPYKFYIVPPGSSSIKIENNAVTNGAQIVLTSLFERPLRFVYERPVSIGSSDILKRKFSDIGAKAVDEDDGIKRARLTTETGKPLLLDDSAYDIEVSVVKCLPAAGRPAAASFATTTGADAVEIGSGPSPSPFLGAFFLNTDLLPSAVGKPAIEGEAAERDDVCNGGCGVTRR